MPTWIDNLVDIVYEPSVIWKTLTQKLHNVADDPTMPQYTTSPGQQIPVNYTNVYATSHTGHCALHVNCQVTYVIYNGHIANESHSSTFTQGGTTAPIQGQGLVGIGGTVTGYPWLGSTGPQEGVLVKDEAPPPERPDDLDFLDWESIARNRARRRGWGSKSPYDGQWLSGISALGANVFPGSNS